MSLFEELTEYTKDDEKIVKSFKVKDDLCQDIFEKIGDDYTIREEIRLKMIDISDNFMESLGVDFFIHDIVLTGSLSNYNWSEYSDVDLHIIIDFEDIDVNMDLIKEFFDSKKNIWNKNHNIKIKDFDVEVYVQDISEPHVSSGVYSILNNEWLIKPTKKSPNIDDRKILEKGEHYAKKIDSLIKNVNNQKTIDNIDILKKKLKTFRQSGLEFGGEYSYENLTFKLLRRNGYIEKLLKLKTDLTDKKLSITQ